MQALEKELANFGKEKDKHIRNAQAKAKKVKADTEVRLHHPVDSLRLYLPCLVIWHAPAEAWSKTLLSRCKRHVCAENVLRALASYIWTRPKGELIKIDSAGCCCLPSGNLSCCGPTARMRIPP